ncbi:MAG: protein jag [Anaerolineae bacterium]|nr:protein jag [Anaerolineae bacterium]
MSEANEFSGKTVEDAIAKGLAALNATREQVEIEIVREGSRGILGLGGENAIVRMTRRVETPPPPLPNVQSDAKELLEGLLNRMGIHARVEVAPAPESEGPDAFTLNIVGNDLGVLIGRRGETLRDLQYLLRMMLASKHTDVKVVVDVAGYRVRRERALRELARRMAERVAASRQPITLEAMPPNERRIIHLTLRDHPTVTTHSIGEGEHRRVMILHK